VIDCKTVNVLDVGDHRVLIGEVVELEIGQGRPLLFYASEYTRLSS
jgi:flavin reductase (DIM6/NTAB) family NADH-FMN oxidoreductase RutF